MLAATQPNLPAGDAPQPEIAHRVILIVCSFSPSHWLAAPPHTVRCRQSVREECSGLVLTTVNPDHSVSGCCAESLTTVNIYFCALARPGAGSAVPALRDY